MRNLDVVKETQRTLYVIACKNANNRTYEVVVPLRKIPKKLMKVENKQVSLFV